jgi:threonine/homoserine/homoserine lactone efflux protein
MISVHDLWLFAISSLLLAITPGPDTLYIVGRSTSQGLKSGVAAALGVGAGIFVHTAAAAVGISAIIAASATAFLMLKLVGAAYLVYVGISLIWSSLYLARTIPLAPVQQSSLQVVFRQGFLTNVLNPKVALFFVAFLPQFVDLNAPNQALSLLLLGVLFNLIGTLWNLGVACSAGWLTEPLRQRSGVGVWFHRSAGGFLVYFGARLAFDRDG